MTDPPPYIDLVALLNGSPQTVKEKKRYHVIRIGKKYMGCPLSFSKQSDKKSKTFLRPPKHRSLKSRQRNLRRKVDRTILDAIVEDGVLKNLAGLNELEDDKEVEVEFDSVDTGPSKLQFNSPTKSQHDTQQSKSLSCLEDRAVEEPVDEDPADEEQGVVEPEAKRARTVPVTPQVDATPTMNNLPDETPLISKLLGKRYDDKNAADVRKVDLLLTEILKTKQVGYKTSFKDSRGHVQFLIQVPVASSDVRFHNSCEWVDQAIEQINSARSNDPSSSVRRIVTHCIKYQVLQRRGDGYFEQERHSSLKAYECNCVCCHAEGGQSKW